VKLGFWIIVIVIALIFISGFFWRLHWWTYKIKYISLGIVIGLVVGYVFGKRTP
jgi:hypothetical protein